MTCKKAFPVLFLLLLTFLSYGQIGTSWEEVTHHNSEHLEIVLISNNDFIYGYSHLRKRLFYRDYNSSKWQLIMEFDDLFSVDRIKEINDKIYFSFGNELIKHDPNSGAIELFIDIGRHGEIEDFIQLETGNWLIVDDNDLILYDFDGNRKKSSFRDGRYARLINTASQNYIAFERGGSYVVQEYSDDLSYFGPLMSFLRVDGRIINKWNRIYTSRGFTRNPGREWSSYSVGEFISFDVLSFDGLVFNTSDSLIFSDRIGVKTNAIPIPDVFSLDYSNYRIVVKNNLIIFSNPNCGEDVGFEYDLVSKEWKSTIVTTGQPFSERVYAANNENLYVQICQSQLTYKHNDLSPWENLIIGYSQSGKSNFDLTTILPDGSAMTLLSNSSFYSSFAYRSNDAGVNWNPIGALPLNPYSKFISKSRGIYLLRPYFEDQLLSISSDFGRSWRVKTLLLPFEYFIEECTITPSDKLLFHVKYQKDTLFSYDINSRSLEILGTLDVDFIWGSFSDETVFGLNIEDKKLYRSYNGGQSFTVLPLSIELDLQAQYHIDQFDHLFLYDQNHVYISKDLGDNWTDISPDNFDVEITDLDVSPDGFIYLANYGAGILKSDYLQSSTSNTETTNQSISIYPNPVRDVLHLQFPVGFEPSSVQIYDVTGQKVSASGLAPNTSQVDVSHLPPGCYIFSVKDGLNQCQEKFVKLD